MRVATVDGLVTLFYDGSKELFNQELNDEWNNAYETAYEHYLSIYRIIHSDYDSLEERWRKFWTKSWELWNLSTECKSYWRERLSWQQIILVEGVAGIPEYTFYHCSNIRRVNFADTVTRIEMWAFCQCNNLIFIKLSLRLEYIGPCAFMLCNLSSVFIPPRCSEIDICAFSNNANLTILNVPQDTELGFTTINATKLNEKSPFGDYDNLDVVIPPWLKNINNSDQFALHRVCSSFEPTLVMILDVMMDKGGPKAFKVKNSIGITPSRYLEENPYVKVTEKEIVEKYILQMVGEL